LKPIDHQQHLAASEVVWLDELIQATGGTMRRKRKLAAWSRSLAGMAAVALALAHGVPVGSEPPKPHGQTLDGKAILPPDAAVGKVTLLVLGASRKGGERTEPWKDHFVADFGSKPNATYYVAALPQGVPGPFRDNRVFDPSQYQALKRSY
jgi:hypothetical protein